MGRSLSDMGLSVSADKYLSDNNAVRIGKYKVEDVFYFQGMDYPIYRLADGSIVEEYEQTSVWDSGPNIYRAIRNAHTKSPIADTLWPQFIIESNHSYE